MEISALVSLPLVGFLAGSVPFGLLVARAKGVDIRKHGSGNIGATNVLRVVGRPYGIAVFVLDCLKGLLPVLWARGDSWAGTAGELLPILTGLAGILGHNYSPWVGFKGGKGIATSAGVLMGLFPWSLGIGLVVWWLVFKWSRYVSVASMVAAVSIPCTELVLSMVRGDWRPYSLGFTIFIAIMAIWRHRSNIRNLREGKENRFPSKRQVSKKVVNQESER